MSKPDVWPGMTKRQHKGIGRYLRDVADMIGLREWTLELSYEPAPGEDSLADCASTGGRLKARVRVCSDFNDLPLEVKRLTLIHELVHCHQQKGVEVFFENVWVHKSIGLSAYNQLASALDKDQEIMTDNIAVVLGRLLDDSHLLKYLERT